MSEVVISILMPVYNAEKYLENSIDSIRKQTFQQWELILVNDGSTDKSGQICDELAKEDKRIRVIHKENTGVSDTRNVLLDNAKGKYIGFVDSDDYIDRNMYEFLYATICKNNTEMCVCGFCEEHKTGDKMANKISKNYYPAEFLNINDLKDKFMKFANSEILNPLWNKLYKRKIIVENNIKFLEGVKTGEDFIFNLDYISNINSISFCKETLYHYAKRNDDSITYQYIDDMYNKGLEIHEKLESFLYKMDFYTDENKYILYGNHLMGVFSAILNLFHKDCSLNLSEKKDYIRNIINRDYVNECARNRKKDKGLVGITSLLVRINNPLLIMSTFKGITFVRKVI